MIYKENASLSTKRYCRSARYFVLPFTTFYYLLLPFTTFYYLLLSFISCTSLSSLGDHLWKRKNYMS